MDADGRHLATLVARIDRDDLVARLLTSFREGIAGYARLPDAILGGQIRTVLRGNVDLCLRWVATGEEPTDEDLAPFRISAKNRAAEGVPLEDLLHAYRAGGKGGWRALVDHAQGEEREALPRAAELVMDYIDRVSATVAQAYLEERQHFVSEEERGLRAVLDALTNGDEIATPLRAVAERLELPLTGRFRPFALTLGEASARDHARHAATLRGRGVLALTEGDRVVGLVPEGRDGLRGLPAGGLIVSGRDAQPGKLQAELRDVRTAVDIGRRLGRTGTIPTHELVLELLLTASPRIAAELEARVLKPLDDAGARARATLTATIEAYLGADLDRSATARRLHVHPNTVDYRLRRVQELTGLRLSNPSDLALLVLALRQRMLAGESAAVVPG